MNFLGDVRSLNTNGSSKKSATGIMPDHLLTETSPTSTLLSCNASTISVSLKSVAESKIFAVMDLFEYSATLSANTWIPFEMWWDGGSWLEIRNSVAANAVPATTQKDTARIERTAAFVIRFIIFTPSSECCDATTTGAEKRSFAIPTHPPDFQPDEAACENSCNACSSGCSRDPRQ